MLVSAAMAESRILIVEDEPAIADNVAYALKSDGMEAHCVGTGRAALDAHDALAPALIILDVGLPDMSGVDCAHGLRRVSASVRLVLVTGYSVGTGLASQLDPGDFDALTKPFDPEDLRARMAVGRRIIDLQEALQAKVRELADERGHVRQLQGLLPICMFCKKIRDDESTWHQLEAYIAKHSGANFTHSLCGECMTTHYPGLADKDPVEV